MHAGLDRTQTTVVAQKSTKLRLRMMVVGGALGALVSACRTTGPTSEALMVGGKPVASDQWEARHTVVLFTASGEQLCTATRIAPNYLLTAAHCVVNPIPGLKLGYGAAIDKSASNAKTPGPKPLAADIQPPVEATGINVLAMIGNPVFATKTPNGEENDHDDIGLVVFTGDLPIDITPIANFADFPASDSDLQKAGDNTLVKAGYGKRSDADVSLPQLNAGPLTVAHIYPDVHELAFKTNTKTGTCNGDSGGPAYVAPASANALPKLLGVTSRSPDGELQDLNTQSSTPAAAAAATAAKPGDSTSAPSAVAASAPAATTAKPGDGTAWTGSSPAPQKDGIADKEHSGDCDSGNGIDTDARYFRAWIAGVSIKLSQHLAASGQSLPAVQLTMEAADQSAALVDKTAIEALPEALQRVRRACELDGAHHYDESEGACTKIVKPGAVRAGVAANDGE